MTIAGFWKGTTPKLATRMYRTTSQLPQMVQTFRLNPVLTPPRATDTLAMQEGSFIPASPVSNATNPLVK
ncbi:uncharacterized protein LOC144158350 isoform X6 [Haemaphysalis longicornis]